MIISLLPLGEGAKYCDQRVCMSVCPYASHISKITLQISPNLPNMLPVAVARSFYDGNAICYVLAILWMTSCFHKMVGIA